MISKLHYWFKSHCDFAELVDFPIGQSGEAIRWRVCLLLLFEFYCQKLRKHWPPERLS